MRNEGKLKDLREAGGEEKQSCGVGQEEGERGGRNWGGGGGP